MFTRKSLIVCVVMVLSLVGVGTVSSFAASVKSPKTKNGYALPYNGVAAIKPSSKGLLTLQEVRNYLANPDFVGGSTLNNTHPTVQNLRLTDITHLNRLSDIVIPLAGVILPDVAGSRRIYYAELEGPFALNRDLPLSALRTLFPSATNMPVLTHMPVLNNLPVLDDLMHLTETNTDNPGGLLGLASQGGEEQPDSTLTQNVLQTIYEVFDAQNGHLLAWG